MRYLLDSNIIIGFLNGDKKIAEWIFAQKKKDYFSNLNISLITKIETLSLKTLKDYQIEEIGKFLDVFDPIFINDDIIETAAALRRKNILSLGDAIVAGSAISRKMILVTNDKTLANKAKSFTEVIILNKD